MKDKTPVTRLHFSGWNMIVAGFALTLGAGLAMVAVALLPAVTRLLGAFYQLFLTSV